MNTYDYEYRVRYVDTDKLGISYYANYFVWFEASRTEYFRALGLPYTESEKKGVFLSGGRNRGPLSSALHL